MSTESLLSQNFPLKNGQYVLLDGRAYQILKPLGQGGIGDVYLAQEHETGTQVALKHLYYKFDIHPEIYYKKVKILCGIRFLPDTFALPFAVSDFNEKQNSFFYAMPLLEEGYRPLSTAVNHFQFLNLEQKLSVCRQIAHAFAQLHRSDLIYGDPSCNNFYFRLRSDGTVQAKIIDTDTTTIKSLPLSLSGTGYYRAPEIFRGLKAMLDGTATASSTIQHTIHSDIHALSAVLFHLLVGCHPLDGSANVANGSNEQDMILNYGTDPVYIFDPSQRNPPLSPILEQRFHALPTSVQLYFNAIFSRTCLMDPSRRPTAETLERILNIK